MALDHEIESMAARAEREVRANAAQRAAKHARRMWDFRIIQSYRALFLDAEGNLKPEAVDVIADMSAVAKIGMADLSEVPEPQLRDRAGRRTMVLHMINRVDLGGAQLSDLAAKLRREPQ